MKKLVFFLIAIMSLMGCGVGVHSVQSGVEDAAYIFFTDSEKYPIQVFVGDVEYNVETIETRRYKADRKIKETVANTIKVKPGQHDVRVVVDGNQKFAAKLFLSASESKNIQL